MPRAVLNPDEIGKGLRTQNNTLSGRNALVPKHQKFVKEFIIDLNGSQAALRAGYSPRNVGVTAHHLLKNPKVQVAIKQEMALRNSRLNITADSALIYHWQLGRAELPIPWIIGPCRHCHGQDHRYHFTLDECREEKIKHHQRMMMIRNPSQRREFDDKGGIGYDIWKPIYSLENGFDHNCPECHGVGIPIFIPIDPDSLTTEQKALFTGVKVGKDGKVEEVMFADRFKHLARAEELAGFIQPRKAIEVLDPTQQSHEQLESAVRSAIERGLITETDLAEMGQEDLENVIEHESEPQPVND